jgi:predicted benzoate:H+ symporter BenE
VDWHKIWLAVAALMAPGIILGILAQFVASMGEFMPFAVIALVAGVAIAAFIFFQAQKMDDI